MFLNPEVACVFKHNRGTWWGSGCYWPKYIHPAHSSSNMSVNQFNTIIKNFFFSMDVVDSSTTISVTVETVGLATHWTQPSIPTWLQSLEAYIDARKGSPKSIGNLTDYTIIVIIIHFISRSLWSNGSLVCIYDLCFHFCCELELETWANLRVQAH